ncbi:MAG: hypothetical protein K1W04_08010 [Oscillospiraceae bacterium]
MMFKDKAGINHRNGKDYADNLHKLAQAIQKGKDAERKLLLNGSEITYKHSPDHSACTYDPVNDSQRKTEKRLCRCIYFLNCPKVKEEQRAKCAACSYLYKTYTLNDGYVIQDYEVAAPYNEHNGVDLIWTAPDGKTYAVEIKPTDSAETIIRMAAEILTYTLTAKGEDKLGEPAICFFKETSKGKPSAQWREYLDWKDNDDFKIILTRVHVFYFTSDGDRLTIHDTKDEPICK